ncbi:MAG: hypothetical protein NTY02_01350, partial [Acidobacteria bacterium]|nr:hypothetical protein [Acidobacteriota bacterium]
ASFGVSTEPIAQQHGVAVGSDAYYALLAKYYEMLVAHRATPSAPWIHVAPASGSGPGVIAITVDASRLGAGAHQGKVTIDAGDADDSPAAITIVAQISAGTRAVGPPPTAPKVHLSAVAGAAAPVGSTVSLDGPGGTPTDWQATSDQPWLSAQPAAGTTPTSVTIAASASQLPAGVHQGFLRFLNDAGDPLLVVPVALTVAGTAPPAATDAAKPPGESPAVALAITTQQLPPATRNMPYSQAIPVRGGTPPYDVRIVQGRLPHGLAMKNGALSGLTQFPGNYLLMIAVTDSAKPPVTVTQQVLLKVIILQPDTALVVDPPAINLLIAGAQRTQRARVFVGSGRQQLEWKASTDAAWLRVAPQDGISPGMLQIEVLGESLAPGAYVATLTVTMEGAPNSPARIPVQVVIRK